MTIFPRIVTSYKGHGAFVIADYAIGDSILRFRAHFEPRGERGQVLLGLDPDLLTEFDPTQWGLSAKTEDNAVALLVATIGWMTGNLLGSGHSNLAFHFQEKGKVNGYSYAWRLHDIDPPSDADLWKYVASKIYWSWQYGLHETVFDVADDLQLGLPPERLDEKRGLHPGQLDRVATIGVGEYWQSDHPGRYKPLLSLLTDFPRNFPEIG